MRGQRGQTALDAALMTSGSAEAAWAIAKGQGMDLTDGIEGLEIAEAADPEDEETAATLQADPPATAIKEQASNTQPIGKAMIGQNEIA